MNRCMLAWSKALLLANRCRRTPNSPAKHKLIIKEQSRCSKVEICRSASLMPDHCLTEPVPMTCRPMDAWMPRTSSYLVDISLV